MFLSKVGSSILVIVKTGATAANTVIANLSEIDYSSQIGFQWSNDNIIITNLGSGNLNVRGIGVVEI